MKPEERMVRCLVLTDDSLKTVTKRQFAESDVVLYVNDIGEVEIVKCRYGKTKNTLNTLVLRNR